mmetsp:Transcript_74866/g.243178  ORF Transcript_74866/g.243178 Transcript_74866/m.243178 type:complete len:497 (+) Transcript_74866:595-2085(+)
MYGSLSQSDPTSPPSNVQKPACTSSWVKPASTSRARSRSKDGNSAKLSAVHGTPSSKPPASQPLPPQLPGASGVAAAPAASGEPGASSPGAATSSSSNGASSADAISLGTGDSLGTSSSGAPSGKGPASAPGAGTSEAAALSSAATSSPRGDLTCGAAARRAAGSAGGEAVSSSGTTRARLPPLFGCAGPPPALAFLPPPRFLLAAAAVFLRDRWASRNSRKSWDPGKCGSASWTNAAYRLPAPPDFRDLLYTCSCSPAPPALPHCGSSGAGGARAATGRLPAAWRSEGGERSLPTPAAGSPAAPATAVPPPLHCRPPRPPLEAGALAGRGCGGCRRLVGRTPMEPRPRAAAHRSMEPRFRASVAAPNCLARTESAATLARAVATAAAALVGASCSSVALPLPAPSPRSAFRPLSAATTAVGAGSSGGVASTGAAAAEGAGGGGVTASGGGGEGASVGESAGGGAGEDAGKRAFEVSGAASKGTGNWGAEHAEAET